MVEVDSTSVEEPIRIPDILPVLPLKDVVTFPYIILPLSVGREGSVLAVDEALADNRVVLLLTQKDPKVESPAEEDFHQVGTAAAIMRMLKLPDGRIRILVQGLSRAKVEHFGQTEPFLQAKIQMLDDSPAPADSEDAALEMQALIRNIKENLDKAVHLGRSISPEVMIIASNLDEPGRLADLIASNLDLGILEAQEILELLNPIERLWQVGNHLQKEIQLLTMQQQISLQAKGEMDKTQRDYYLRQQLKAIQQELGDVEELKEEIAEFRRAAEEKGMPPEAKDELERQLKKLERSHPDSADSAITRGYLEALTSLPWATLSEDQLDLGHAQQVLDKDHYDLEKVKERILEYLAVRQLNPASKGPILCFVGPPGVGKTSLGRSIARALGREFIRISLGGIRDEAEIRGHRRTYVGAMPGRIIQSIGRAGSSNPVFMLDEVDKIGTDYRGDPSSALLEVLDPEQNSNFRDHYLGVAYDLSKVMFITTANLLEPIQPAFLDRMEVIRLSGYTASVKLEIARRHLIPKQLQEHGLNGKMITFSTPSLRKIIADYTREAGLRNLERELAAVCRKVAVSVASGRTKKTSITPAKVETLLGPPKHFSEDLLDRDRVGVATGLAWTATGGDLLFIEVVAVAGTGKLVLTGRLGEVMKESAQAALSYARSCEIPGLAENFFSEHDLHVHVPAGSIPKDGPSAGITIAAAILSVLTGKPVKRRIAMTGEITLRGDIMPIGGLKEKILAARSAGIEAVLVPHLNRRNFSEIPEEVTANLSFHFVEHMEDVLALALGD
jgi:ATP-dependent Lon protease